MSLRNRLLIAGAACLLVVVAAFLAVQRRQEQVLFDQLDAQLTLVADSASSFAGRVPPMAQGPLNDTGELYVGVVANDQMFTLASPVSTPGLAPDLDEVRNAPRAVPLTLGTSDGAGEIRTIVEDLDGAVLVVGQSTEAIDDAIRSLRVSGLVAVAAIGAFALVVGSWVNRLSIQPIRAATEVARAITSGRRDERVPESPANTEAATLGSAMNLMLDTNAATEARLRSFVADASHELRTPLTTLVGYADLHRQGLLTSDEAVDDAMRRIRGEAKRMSVIVEHLLLLASLDEGSIPIERSTVDVGQLLDDVAADARVVQPDRPITVDIPAPVEASADPDRLLQAVSILVNNALTHTPESAALSLGAEADDDALVIRVADRGPGIPGDHLGRVFDRFYRVNGARSRAQSGNGLGLAIAKSIVEAHGGSLDVDSVVDRGATFTICVPAVRADHTTEASMPSGT